MRQSTSCTQAMPCAMAASQCRQRVSDLSKTKSGVVGWDDREQMLTHLYCDSCSWFTKTERRIAAGSADVSCQNGTTGSTCLMQAAFGGPEQSVQALLGPSATLEITYGGKVHVIEAKAGEVDSFL